MRSAMSEQRISADEQAALTGAAVALEDMARVLNGQPPNDIWIEPLQAGAQEEAERLQHIARSLETLRARLGGLDMPTSTAARHWHASYHVRYADEAGQTRTYGAWIAASSEQDARNLLAGDLRGSNIEGWELVELAEATHGEPGVIASWGL